jgi:hypothetical protein
MSLFRTLRGFPLSSTHRLVPSIRHPSRAFLSYTSRSLRTSCYDRTKLVSDSQRYVSSASSTQWKARQFKDQYARDAKVQGLKSRAAFKLLEMNQKYKLFKPGYTVVDLVGLILVS